MHMMIKRFLLWYAVVHSLLSCSQKSDQVEPKLPVQYTSRKLVKAFFPAQGGYVEGNDLITFVSPFFAADDVHNPLIKPALYKVTAEGAIRSQHTLEREKFNSMTAAFTPATRAGSNGYHPLGIKVHLVKTSGGEIFASNKSDATLSVTKVLPDGAPCNIALNGVIALTLAAGDTMYALTSQTYYSVPRTGTAPTFELLKPMVIWKIAPDCSISEYYRFPASFTHYSGGGKTGTSSNEWTPMENEADMCVTQRGDLLISLMLSGKVYKLSKDKTLTEFITTIESPSGITTDRYDNVYVVSAPTTRQLNLGEFEITKPAQIYRIVNQQQEMIYQGESNRPFIKSHYYVPELKKWYSSDMSYNINVTQDLKIFLEDYAGGEITLLK